MAWSVGPGLLHMMLACIECAERGGETAKPRHPMLALHHVCAASSNLRASGELLARKVSNL